MMMKRAGNVVQLFINPIKAIIGIVAVLILLVASFVATIGKGMWEEKS